VISTRVKIEVRIIRFIDLTVLTLGEIFKGVVDNPERVSFAMGGLPTDTQSVVSLERKYWELKWELTEQYLIE
jgi:hypothetical protein